MKQGHSHAKSLRLGMGMLSALAALLLAGSQDSAFAQGIVTDDFDSGVLDAGWQQRNVVQPLGGFVENSFPANGSGKAFRLRRGSANMAPLGQSQAYGTGRAWLFRTNDYGDFYVAMDLVAWNNNTNQAMVLLAHASGYDESLGAGFPPGLGTVDGYVCNYDNVQDGTESGDRLGGEFQINVVINEGTRTLAAAEVTLIPGRSYRQVFKGVGSTLTGQLYDIEDLTAPIVTIVAETNVYASGKSGIVTYHRDGGTHPNLSDMTVDNYYSGPADPNLDIAPAIRHPIVGTPQVVTRTPVKRFANFHPAASGISFNARTFTAGQINASATKLYLNGVDVSSALAPFPANGSSVNFTTKPGTLSPNMVYAARIELEDTTGTLKSTNTFWFDTFTDATVRQLKTVEIEDYNYSGGNFQLDPIAVSGIDKLGGQVNGAAFDLGYFDATGVPEVDFFKTNNGFYNSTLNEYRNIDGSKPDERVQITQGSYIGSRNESGDIIDALHPQGSRIHDTQRSQYAATNVWEYQVRLTSPGDWFNYTRVFQPTNYYVYLRCGSFGATTVYLDRVTSDPKVAGQTTERLGTFNVGNHLMRLNYRYVPLMAGTSPAVISLADTNTLRLTLGGAERKDERLVVLDYLLFVPTSDGPTVADTFADGNDTANPAWQHYDPLGGVTADPASFIVTNGVYHLYSPVPIVPDAGPARAGSFVSGASYSDFYVSADLLDFDDTVRQAFGIAARVNSPGLLTTTGYLFSWEPGGGALPGTDNGDLDISILVSESPVGQIEKENSNLHLTRGKSYRFVFMGKGFDFVAKVYELPDTSNPIKVLTATDSDPTSFGRDPSVYARGQVGLIAASQGGFAAPGDATFDNFLATTAEPKITVDKSGNNVVLTWPLIPFRLQTSPSLTSPTWTDVTTGIGQAGGQNVYAVAPGGAQYYRLVYP